MPDRFQHATGQRDVSQLGSNRLRTPQHVAREPQVFAQTSRATAQKIATAHIRKQAYVGFRHGHLGALGHHAHAGALADAHATAHDNAVHESDVRLAVGVNQVIKAVLFCEKVAQRSIASVCCLVEISNITTCTKSAKGAFFARAAHRDSQHLRVTLPGQQRLGQGANHLQRQSVECLGSVQGDAADTAFNLRDDIRHCFVSSLTIH